MVNQTMAAKFIVNALNFMMSGGGGVPVELVSFTASAEGKFVRKLDDCNRS
ncbi:hypothetical protein MASR2M39_25450 [Ignavibacteriales bacterium]